MESLLGFLVYLKRLKMPVVTLQDVTKVQTYVHIS